MGLHQTEPRTSASTPSTAPTKPGQEPRPRASMNDRSLPESVDVLASEKIHGGPVFGVRRDRIRLGSGLECSVDVVEHPGAVGVAARHPDGGLLLVRQYRHACESWLEEIPAGRIDPGEDPLSAAKRELEEETGFRAKHWKPIVEVIPAPGFCSEIVYLFFADGLEPVPGGGLTMDPDEEISVVSRSLEDLLGLPRADAKTLIAAHWVLREPPAPGAPDSPSRG